MTQLTHEEARHLIQLRADQELDLASNDSLQSHLEGCTECQTYANHLFEVEGLLQRVTHGKWDKRPAPLSVAVVLAQVRGNQIRLPGNLMTTRIATITVAVLALLISTWQFSRTALSPTPETLTLALPIPTPSAPLTGTSLSLQDCDSVVYRVKPGDVLDRIALEFAVQKEDIIAMNQMTSEIVFVDQEIRIPLCNSTPTGTIGAPTTTITITPQFTPLSTTPG